MVGQHGTESTGKQIVHTLGFKTTQEWHQYCKSKDFPIELPAKPDRMYKNLGWKGFGDWLGSEKYAPISFHKAREYAQSLNLKGTVEWRHYCKSGNKPNYIPSNPDKTYKTQGWISFGDWLGTGIVASFLRKYKSFKDARQYVHSLKLKNQAEWTAFYKTPDFPEDIPASPSRVYKNEGWISFGDWLGTGVIATNLHVYKDFIEVKKYVKTLGLKTIKEWLNFCESGKKPFDIPRNVQRTYSSEWKGWPDFLGKK